MSRLLRKKAENVYPGESSEKLVINTPDSEYTQNYYDKEFRTAQQLISGLQLVQTNERVIELARDIKAGFFDDISSIDNAAEYWDDWMNRTRDIFGAKNIYLAGAQPHDPTFASEYTLIYQTAKQLIQQLPMPENNYRVVEIARAIKTGQYEDISPITEAGNNWSSWLGRTKELFRNGKTLLAGHANSKFNKHS